MEEINFLLPPLVICLILVGIHCYLGLHVLARGVIFVDLALAQVAAFGTVFSSLLDIEHDDPQNYWISLLFTLLVAWFLAFSNRRKEISQEAIIGILFAFFSAATVLFLDRLNHGSEHLKHALVGQVLWVTWDDVIKVGLIYTGVSIVHYIFRKQLIENSFGVKGSWWWDFVFYGLFGVVITSSVSLAGVLLVFTFLIVPSLLSSIFFKSIFSRLIFGWGLGFVLCVAGLAISYYFDFPAGALLVVLFSVVPLVTIFLMGSFLLRVRH